MFDIKERQFIKQWTNTENKLEIMNVNIIANQGNNVLVDNISNNTMIVIEPLIDTKAGTIVNPIVK